MAKKMQTKIISVKGEHAFNKQLNIFLTKAYQAGIEIDSNDIKYSVYGDMHNAVICTKENS